MGDSCGWICLHRKTIHSMVFKNEGLFKVWMWCLLRANHEKKWVSFKTGKGSSIVEVGPGQFVFGRKTSSKELDMKMSTVWDRMKILKKHQNIDMTTNSHYTLVSIINWDTYQDKEITTDIQTDNQPTTNRQPTDTNNNDNNENNKDTLSSSGETDDGNFAPKNKKENIPYDEIVSLFNEILSELPEVRFLSESRKKALKSKWHTEEITQHIEWWREYFEFIKESDFLMGRKKGSDWQCDFDWILKLNNFIKIREGKYVNR